MSLSKLNVSSAKSDISISSDELREVIPSRLAHVFDENPRGLKAIMPKLLPLRSMSLVKLEKMQHDIEEMMKAGKKASNTTAS
ncbi:hypothetical protein BV898_02228 [Hypsibius exemplaris]|uniref:BBSome-interacting protein 1 n=1 Tax=Hypsibius exemplaris TaxID=2072580 RepID=A0A1W0X8L8_HYPEX|nr:hypothetical protein BV898_02228 [Hypsibius exemplaris]